MKVMLPLPIQCPAFQNFTLFHFAFTKKLTSVPVFTNQKKFEEDFHIYEKRQKVSSICFVVSLNSVGAVRVAPPRAFPGNYTQRLIINPL